MLLDHPDLELAEDLGACTMLDNPAPALEGVTGASAESAQKATHVDEEVELEEEEKRFWPLNNSGTTNRIERPEAFWQAAEQRRREESMGSELVVRLGLNEIWCDTAEGQVNQQEQFLA